MKKVKFPATNKSGNPLKSPLVLGAIITTVGTILGKLFDIVVHKKDSMASAEANIKAHCGKNEDNVSTEEKMSSIRVKEKGQMLELELYYQRMLRKIKRDEVCDTPSESPMVTPATPDKEAYSLTSIMQMEVPPSYSIVGNILDSGGFLTIVADPGVGKTTIAYQIAYCACKGIHPDFVNGDFPAFQPMEVHYYDGENSAADLQKILAQCSPLDLKDLHVILQPRFDTVKEFMADIRRRVDRNLKDQLLIIDNVFKFFNASQPTLVAKFFSEIEQLQKDVAILGKQLTVIILDHAINNPTPYKPITLQKMGGASHIPQFSKSIITLCPVKGSDNLIGLKALKIRFSGNPGDVEILERTSGEMPGYVYVDTVNEDTLKDGYKAPAHSGPTEAQKQLILKLCASHPKPADKDIAKQLGVSRRTLAYWKKNLGLTQNP